MFNIRKHYAVKNLGYDDEVVLGPFAHDFEADAVVRFYGDGFRRITPKRAIPGAIDYRTYGDGIHAAELDLVDASLSRTEEIAHISSQRTFPLYVHAYSDGRSGRRFSVGPFFWKATAERARDLSKGQFHVHVFPPKDAISPEEFFEISLK